MTFKNPKPVASGPFTTITRLTTQDIVYGKNPTYWKAGAPKVPCLEYIETTSNDAALLLIQSGKVDWTHNFVPNVESVYSAKDPAHYHSFYATTAYPISLMFDTTQYPYSLVPFRHAVSMAINRDDVSKLGEYGYAPPTDAIGLGGIFPQWVTDPAIKAEAKRLATYDPAAAKKTLTDAGFTYNGNKLIDPKGNPVALRGPRHRRLVRLGRLAADHHQEPPGRRHRRDRQDRARLELLVPERVRHEGADAALAERLAGLALRVLLRQPAPERAHRVR